MTTAADDVADAAPTRFSALAVVLLAVMGGELLFLAAGTVAIGRAVDAAVVLVALLTAPRFGLREIYLAMARGFRGDITEVRIPPALDEAVRALGAAPGLSDSTGGRW